MNKRHRTATIQPVVQFCLHDDLTIPHNLQYLTSVLRAKLRTKHRRWKGRVVIYQEDCFIYNLFTQKKEETIVTQYGIFQLRDGSLIVQQQSTNHEYSPAVTFVRDLNICGVFRAELSNGLLLFSNSLYQRNTQKTTQIAEGVSTALELQSGLLATTSIGQQTIALRDLSFNTLKTIPTGENHITCFVECRPNVLLVSCSSYRLFEVNIITNETKDYSASVFWNDMILLKNGTVALISHDVLQIVQDGQIIRSFNIQMTSILNTFFQVQDNIVGYTYPDYLHFCVQDCVSGKVTQYHIPEKHLLINVLFD